MPPGPDYKPRRRIKESKWRYRQMVGIHLDQNRACECGCGRRSESIHHLLRRAHGDDVYSNFVALAGDGTRLCHGAITSMTRVYDLSTGEYIEPLEVLYGIRDRLEMIRVDAKAYLLGKRSPEWIDAKYPRRPPR